jgi:FtsH-binding integral membrane protein
VGWVGIWARILPGVFAPAVLNGLIIFVSGHALNQAKLPVPRWESIIIIALAVTGVIVTAPFTNGNLTIEDKIGALGVWACFIAAFVGIVLPMNGWETPVGIALIACLAWIQIRRMKLKRATRRAGNCEFLV